MTSHVFGPVPSRRLGRSLGVDLTPFKTCSYDCVYCQLGRTTCHTAERKEWIPLDPVLDELQDKLRSRPDYVTLSGSGEPTLHSRLGELIDRVKRIANVPVAVLTNGSLLWQDELQRQLADADLVMPSLDAGRAETFQLVNRPHPDIVFDEMLSGLIEFRQTFRGQYWLESLLVRSITDTDSELAALRECVARIKPDRVLLSTVTRPPADSDAFPVPHERLTEAAPLFTPPAEVVEDFSHPDSPSTSAAGPREILELLARRPCTVDDIAGGLALHRNEVIKHLDALAAKELIETRSGPQERLYQCQPRQPGD